ncbi:hypothetical protein B0I27_101330 [Arcticibacter pallidicorallinus]|uniref:Uncharacterized protein n=1 Tax=Arcticibacter pallidicorallinus TaxID=1259464 RepID=A0A2T0UBP2_9SPHI|nr:hypothetical protein [Arcticibacter pallidicorallinus]PRY55361.1 hypothetical protein B0I27_101330 [Arcticibacter pallidicorallinus]
MEEAQFDYREEILQSACMMCVVYRELFVYALNAALCGELSDLREVFEEGEEYPGDISLLEALEDPNIKLLLELMYDLEKTGDSLLNINNIDDATLKEALAKGMGDECVSELNEDEELGSYEFWMNDAMGYAHLSIYYLMQQCYRLTHNQHFISEEADKLLSFPTEESLKLIDEGDQNVAMLSSLCFRMSDKTHALCESLINYRKSG